MKRIAIQTTLAVAIEIIELAKKHGKKPGDSMLQEIYEIAKKDKTKMKMLGYTDKDLDLLAGDLREQGLKVFNMKEAERKQKDK